MRGNFLDWSESFDGEVEVEFLIGNGIGWLLKHKWEGFATKMIPVALFVWNVLYHSVKMIDPSAIPEMQGASFLQADIVHVGWFGDLFGSFAALAKVAAIDTAKQMAVHSVAKNTFMQTLLPQIAKGAPRKR